MENEVCDESKDLQVALIDFNTHKVETHGENQHALGDLFEDPYWQVLGRFGISVVSVEVSCVIECLVFVKVSHGTPMPIMIGVF